MTGKTLTAEHITQQCLICGKPKWAHTFGSAWEHRYAEEPR